MASSDLDTDGDQDLAVINRQGHLRVLLNDGNGCFANALVHERLWPATSDGVWPSIPHLTDVAAADLNRDGITDLAVAAGETSGLVSVLSNPGTGRFGPPVHHAACSYVKNVAVADLNGDATNDVAVTSNCFKATVLLNDGPGALSEIGSFGTGYTPEEIAAGDLDGDGDSDLAFINVGISSVTVLQNDGDGVFGTVSGYGVGDNPHDLAIADLDGDGDRDLATANFHSNDVTVLRNNGAGTFAGSAPVPAGSGPDGLAVGDLDGDGRPDLVVANGTGNTVTVLENRGGGTFSVERQLPAGVRPNDVVVPDFDNDGRPDVAVLNQQTENVAIFANGPSACQAPPAEPPNAIVVPLFAKAVRSGQRRQVALNWGVDVRSATVLILRNGTPIVAANDSYHRDDVTRVPGRTFTYRVCERGAFSSCSSSVTVTF
jgi:hypothetical protein